MMILKKPKKRRKRERKDLLEIHTYICTYINIYICKSLKKKNSSYVIFCSLIL